MTTLYKLTDEKGYTRAGHDNACLWGDGVSHSGTGEGDLCGPGWIHAYEHPLLAVVLNPIHAAFSAPRLWVAEGKISKRDGPLKVGCKTLTTLREIPLPVISTAARVRFAILCAKAVCTVPEWAAWADDWLSGKDRSGAAARAEAAARAAAAREAWAEAAAAARAAATAAARAGARAETRAAEAARAADAAADATDLVALIEQAVRDEAAFEAASAKV